MRDVAEVRIGHTVRHGVLVINGEQEVVIGMVLTLRGGNAPQVVEVAKAEVQGLQQSTIIPAGTKLILFYDRIELMNPTIQTVRGTLIEGTVLVGFGFFNLLSPVRGAGIVTVTLIVTPLGNFIVIERFRRSAKLMTLAGLAIALLASVVMTLTLSPVLAALFLRGDHPQEMRLMFWMKQRYFRRLHWTLCTQSGLIDTIGKNPALSHHRHQPAKDHLLRYQRDRCARDHRHPPRRQGGDPCL